MASQANKNIIKVLSLIDGGGKALLADTHAKTPLEHLQRMLMRCNDVFAYYRNLSPKEVERLQRDLYRWDRAAFNCQAVDHITVTSTWLGLLEPILDCVHHNERRKLLKRLHAAIWRLHTYYDRQLNKTHHYQQAARAVDLWAA